VSSARGRGSARFAGDALRDRVDVCDERLDHLVVGERGAAQELDGAAFEWEGHRPRGERGALAADLCGDEARHGRQQRRALHERADRREARHRDAHVAAHAVQILDHTSEVAVVRDDHVLVREVAGAVERAAELHHTRIEEADEVAVEERAARDTRGEAVGDGDRELDLTARQRLAHRAELDRHDHQPDRGAALGEAPEQRRKEPALRAVREAEAHHAPRRQLARLPVERGAHERVEVGTRPVDEPASAARERDAAAVLDEERRADRRREPLEGSAHGRLREVEPRRRGRDAARVVHRHEHAEEVQVEIPSIDGVHGMTGS
jgi:hypothetical protein